MGGKKAKVAELDKLFNEIGTYRNCKDFKALLDFIKRFPQIAPFNAMLIHIQKPGSRYVASAAVWAEHFNRGIKPGARPLVILRPFGPVAFVFELMDTHGKHPFPKRLLNPFKTEGKVSESVFERLKNNLMSLGIYYRVADHGSASGGFVQTSGPYSGEMKIPWGNKEIWVKVLFEMVANRNHPLGTQFATIIHELGHVYCGHLGTQNMKWLDDRRYLGKLEKEFEAECVNWLVCERMGIKNSSAEYLNGYLQNNGQIPNISIDLVLKSVAKIETMIRDEIKPEKSIITGEQEINEPL